MRRFFFCVIYFAYLLCLPQGVYAEDITQNDGFFTYKRFLRSAEKATAIAREKGTSLALREFAKNFSDGVNFFTQGDRENAKEEFLKASQFWPEYYGTDFLLALVCEEQGDIRTAARFYKSYLVKLKNFYEGKYRMSGPLIRVIAGGDIEEYDQAHKLIESRLASHGIQLGKVRSAARMPVFVGYLLALAFFLSVYLLMAGWVIPHFKRMRRIKNPPEGFWVCKYCDTASPDLSKVCTECRRPRDTADRRQYDRRALDKKEKV